MGKIRTKFIGEEEVEKKQKSEQKERSEAKKIKGNKAETDNAIENTADSAEALTSKEAKKKNKKKETIKAISKHGKNYHNSYKLKDKNKTYSLEDAILTIKKMSYVKFDESVEIHINLEKTGLKGEVNFPHATGKTVSVAVLNDEVLAKIEQGIIDFNILIAHPSAMPKLAKFARVLGPKGLMPNPKTGTVSTDPEKAAENFKKGAVRWKTEPKFPIIHQVIGKKSFATNSLVDNAKALISSVGAKNIVTVYLSSSMTPSVKVSV